MTCHSVFLWTIVNQVSSPAVVLGMENPPLSILSLMLNPVIPLEMFHCSLEMNLYFSFFALGDLRIHPLGFIEMISLFLKSYLKAQVSNCYEI